MSEIVRRFRSFNGQLMAKGDRNVAGTITTPAGMAPCVAALEGWLSRCGDRFLCRAPKTHVREGNSGHLTVLVEFESQAAAIAAGLLQGINRGAAPAPLQ